MWKFRGNVALQYLGGLLFLLLAATAQAAERRFIPVPQGSAQSIQVINGLPILSGVGKQLQAATSVAALSSKQGRLMVSVKNQGATAVPLEPQAVIATSAGQVLSLREASQAPAAGPKLIQPGEVFATQYFLELPRKQRGQLAAVQVTVELAGERLSFDFKEVE